MEHIKFNKLSIEDRERKKNRGYGNKPPNKNNQVQGEILQNSIDNQIETALEKSNEFEFKPYLVMKMELEPQYVLQEKDEEKLEYFGVKVINKESKELQVLFADDLKLVNFKKALHNYKEGVIARTKIENEDLFCIIKSISEWSREDRISLKIEDLKDGDYIDCYLWVFDTISKSKEKMLEFRNFISNNNARVCDYYVGESVVIARVQIQNDILEKILENPLVYKVEDIPKFNILHNKITSIKEKGIDEINYDTSQLNPDKSSSICVIDSGVFMQHPLLQGAIGDSKTFYCSEDYDYSTDDFSGHGTKVASICEYGDFSYDDDFIPQIFLLNAKIHDGQYTDSDDVWLKEVESELGEFSYEIKDAIMLYHDGEIDFEGLLNYFPKDKHPYLRMTASKYKNFYEKLIPNQMKEIVEYFYNRYGCRVYNLSQGDSNYVYNGGKPKAWACVLDELQNKYDIIFVVSAGNFRYELYSDYKDISQEYPKYFYNMKECKIIEPANSMNSITVGSMSISNEIYNMPNRINKMSITDRDNISTITRIGPGVINAIKPDFIAYGGDRCIDIDFMGNHKPNINLGLCKLLFNNNNEGLFSWDIGTSYAAPYISHIVGLFLNKYPESSNNLIRAILASSAKIPESIKKQVTSTVNEARNLNKEFLYQESNNYNKLLYYTAGYGYPDKDICLDSLENRVVLMADIKADEDAIKPENMHIFEVPLPKKFRQASGKKKVIVSLAYNPPVRNTRLDYIGISIDYKLIKGKTKEEVIEAYESQKGKEEPISVEKKYECKLDPGVTLRSKGTLQKSIFEFSRDVNFDNDNLYLVVNAKNNWANQSQKYAVVVVLESEDENLKIYNEIKNRIAQTIKTRARV